MGKYQSGQMGQTVNLLSFDFGGSNPSPPTRSAGPSSPSERTEAVLCGETKIAEVAQLVEH